MLLMSPEYQDPKAADAHMAQEQNSARTVPTSVQDNMRLKNGPEHHAIAPTSSNARRPRKTQLLQDLMVEETDKNTEETEPAKEANEATPPQRQVSALRRMTLLECMAHDKAEREANRLIEAVEDSSAADEMDAWMAEQNEANAEELVEMARQHGTIVQEQGA